MQERKTHCGLMSVMVVVAAMMTSVWIVGSPTVWAQGESLDGSDIVAVGPNPIPAGLAELCFAAVITSGDLEYLDRLDVDLPDNWTVHGVWPDSAPPADGCAISLPPVVGVDAGNVLYWQSTGFPPATACGAWQSGIFEFCADVTVPDGTGSPWLFPWNMVGDGWGGDPHTVSHVFGPVNFSPGGAPEIDVDPLVLSHVQASNIV